MDQAYLREMQAVARERPMTEATYYLIHDMQSYLNTCKTSLAMLQRETALSSEDRENVLHIAMQSCQGLDVLFQQCFVDVFIRRLQAMA